MKTNIISVKYEDNFEPKIFGGKAYTYYTAIDLKVGDLVIAPTVSGDKIARVAEINIPEQKVEYIKQYLKLITDKINKTEYIQNGQVMKEAA